MWPLQLQITKSQKDTGENHAISALKFVIIKEFLDLGWNVLLSDIDIVVVQVSAGPSRSQVIGLTRARAEDLTCAQDCGVLIGVICQCCAGALS